MQVPVVPAVVVTGAHAVGPVMLLIGRRRLLMESGEMRRQDVHGGHGNCQGYGDSCGRPVVTLRVTCEEEFEAWFSLCKNM